jgi:hypothetical protein
MGVIKKMKRLWLSIILLILLTVSVSANESSGTVKGRVYNEETKEPIGGVNIILLNTNLGAASDENGNFTIHGVAIGNYNVSFHHIGYQELIRPDVIVRPNRITFLNVGLNSSVLEGQEVTVSAGYFQKEETAPVSVASLNAEEIRRSPGSAADISRVLSVLPSVARVADNVNDLMVRGGSPIENGFFVDNIQIPNINHFPSIGSTGGPIGVLNVDFIDDATFYTGGFSAAYGDRLSSITDIRFRDGNKDEMDAQLDMDMAGFGGVLEGPLPGRQGSWMLSARKSYLDLLVEAIGTGVAPRYGDVQGKVSYDIDPYNKLTLLDIYANNRIHTNRDESIDTENPNYGGFKGQQNTCGLNWRCLWGENGYSNTALSYALQLSNDHWLNAKTNALLVENDSYEGSISLRNTNFYALNNNNKLEFGLNITNERADYNYFLSADTFYYAIETGIDTLIKQTIDLKQSFSAFKGGLYVNYIWTPFDRITTTVGMRGDYYSYNQKYQFSPRLSTTFRLNNLLTVNAATGLFYQNLPLYLLTQSDENKKLKVPYAIHYIVGLDYLLTIDTKLTVELYDKEYRDFPLTRDNPTLFVVDDGRALNYFRNYNLIDGGKAYSRGMELLIQKKLARDFYGLFSASYFRCRYRDLLGQWRNRIYDNQYLCSIIGGYKPNNRWEFSLRWNYAGGVPYTPLDIESLSTTGNGIVYTDKINSKRFPDYHSLNIRFDRRFNFQKSNIVLFLSLWNVYNRKNVSMYYWNEIDNKQDAIYQWSFMPIGGFEWEF